LAAFVILTPISARSFASSIFKERPNACGSTTTKLSPPKAVSTLMLPKPSTSK
jgi:hypothetical protein